MRKTARWLFLTKNKALRVLVPKFVFVHDLHITYII